MAARVESQLGTRESQPLTHPQENRWIAAELRDDPRYELPTIL